MPTEDKAAELKEFARKNNLAIHPKRSFDKWGWLVTQLGRCPCDTKRLHCPCKEVLVEIVERGYCLCKFFMSKEYFEKFVRRG